MVRVLVLGLVSLFVVGACGETEREPHASSAFAGTSTGGTSANLAGSATAAPQAGTTAAGGAGGTSALTNAIAECVHYCDTLEYNLPTALCEDWNRPGWDPEFCHLDPGTSCNDYCTTVYETVQPDCARTLPAVIRCIAPTYQGVGVPAASECWLEDCRSQLFNMTSACYGLREKLAAARATWAASGVTDYELQYSLSQGMTAKVAVRSGSEPTVTPPDAIVWTVPELFDHVESYLNQLDTTAKAEYDPTLGYVVSVVGLQGCTESPNGVGEVVVTPLRR
jgi:hypothetical protein